MATLLLVEVVEVVGGHLVTVVGEMVVVGGGDGCMSLSLVVGVVATLASSSRW